jgi:hypothetical protein
VSAAWSDEAAVHRRRVQIPGGYDIEAHRAASLPISGHWENHGVCDLDGEPWPCAPFLAAPEWVRVLDAHGIYPSDVHMGIVVSAGDTEINLTCTACSRRGKPYRDEQYGRWFPGLTPYQGDRLCWTCTEARLGEDLNPRVRDADGRDTGYRERDYITPIAEGRLSERDRQALRVARRRPRRGSAT